MSYTVGSDVVIADCDLPGCHNSATFGINRDSVHGWAFSGERCWCSEKHKTADAKHGTLIDGKVVYYPAEVMA